MSNFAVSSHRWCLALATKTLLFLPHHFRSNLGAPWYYVLNSKFHFYWPVPPFCLARLTETSSDFCTNQTSLRCFFCLCWMPNRNKTAPVLQLYKHSTDPHKVQAAKSKRLFLTPNANPPPQPAAQQTNKQKQATFSTAAVLRPTPSPSLPANVNAATKCRKKDELRN